MTVLIFLTTLIIAAFASCLISASFLTMLRTCDTIISLNLFTNQKLTDMSLAKMITGFFTIKQQPANHDIKNKQLSMSNTYDFIKSLTSTCTIEKDFNLINHMLDRFKSDYRGIPGHTESIDKLEQLKKDKRTGLRLGRLKDDEMRNC